MSDILVMPGGWDITWDRLAMIESPEVPHPTAVPHPAAAREIHLPTTQNHEMPAPTTAPDTEASLTNWDSWAETSNTGWDANITANSTPIIIAVFGQTGTGKTSFIKSATGIGLEVGHSLTSCTEDVLAVPCQFGSQKVILVDTPGFSDTNISDTDILKRIATWMKDNYDDGYRLSGIIYLHRIIDVRMDGPSLKNLRMMKALCGENTLRNVVLATTMWEKVDADEGLNREAELKQSFWKDMIEGGSTVTRIATETGNDARVLVKSLLKNRPTSTRLQEELHSGKSLVQTEAGTTIRAELERLELKLKREYQDEMVEFKRAQNGHDLMLKIQLRKEMQENNHRIARLEAEKKVLENSTLRVLPTAKRNGLFGLGRYRCLRCDNKTGQLGRWKCRKCNHK